MASPDLFAMIRALRKHDVQFIVIGGVSAVLNGAPVTTFDLDIVHQRSDDNIARLLSALDELGAHFRGHARRIAPNASHLQGPGHSLLLTESGPLDVLGRVDVVNKDYDELLSHTAELVFEGQPLLILDLETLIAIKEGLGRPKDMVALVALRHTLHERNRDG